MTNINNPSQNPKDQFANKSSSQAGNTDKSGKKEEGKQQSARPSDSDKKPSGDRY